MTSSSIICESFNSDIQYSELTPIDLNTTNTITTSSNIIDPITTTTTIIITPPPPATNTTTTATVTNDIESSIIHENNNLPVRCKSLEIKSTEKSLINSTSKKRHRKECIIDVKKRRTVDDNMLQVGSMIPEPSAVYNYTTNKTYEYDELIHDYPKFKSFNQQVNMNRTYSHWMNSYEQFENNKEELTNELSTNRIQLKQSIKKGSTRENIPKTLTNNGNWNTFNDTMNVNHHKDEIDNELSSASELTTAAYNNFVRRVVDDTLDRTVTFCEQPRHAITALENICTRAWPQLEVKRHRNRIRAYLKACRRNSKKNKGQINMKEPPANGLSIEARQLVSKALTLVAGDLDYLRQTMQAEKVKNESLFSSSKLDNSSEKSYSAASTTRKRSPTSYSSKMNLSTITTTTTATANSLDFTDISKPRHDQFETYGADGNYLATAAAAAAAATAMAAVNPANLLKLLPTPIQLNNNTYSSNNININTTATSTSYSLTTSPFTSSSSSSVFSNSPRLLNNDNVNNNENINVTTTTTNSNNSSIDFDAKHDQLLTIQGKYSKRNKLLSHTTWFDDDHLFQASNNNNNNNGNNGHSSSPKLNEHKFISSDKDFNIESEINRQSNLINFYRLYLSNDPSHNNNNNNNNNDLKYCSPPPAHISSTQYSPIINQILDRLTDSSLLTHNDVEFFIQNYEITKVAIQQARCRSNLILKKIEIVENQIKSSSIINSKTMPLNLS
ncbi:unnamed protein product [Schistosoma mattheei]|uniref:Nucleolar protein 4 helical domain-containing protein n=1 Tax=Schistosoma mattheei TaxID=31246 RepID=A0AA85BGB4_9TREM|nr:unnamed protein product [Schistosoma mattheei]